MGWLGLPWPDPDSSRRGEPSVLGDLRSGQAGAVLRLALSFASAAVLVAVLMFSLGMVELSGGRVDDEHAFTGLAITGAVWCGIVAWVWLTYRRWRRIIVAAVTILGIWLVAIPMAVLVAETTRTDGFLIAACIFSGVAGTLGTVIYHAHRGAAGRPMADREGTVLVKCPGCGYSMVGLESCQCPECGAAYTIDKLIGEQDYAALRRLPPADEQPAGRVVRPDMLAG